MAQPEIWIQQEGETPKAYEAFCAYRDMGADRSLLKVHRQRVGNEKATSVPGFITNLSDANDWLSRARAYDAYLELTARKGREEAHTAEIAAYRERCRKAAIQTGEMALQVLLKAGQRLQTLAPGEIEPQVLPAYLRAAASVMEASLNAEAEAVGVRALEAILDTDRKPKESE